MEEKQSSSGASSGEWRGPWLIWRLQNDNASDFVVDGEDGGSGEAVLLVDHVNEVFIDRDGGEAIKLKKRTIIIVILNP